MRTCRRGCLAAAVPAAGTGQGAGQDRLDPWLSGSSFRRGVAGRRKPPARRWPRPTPRLASCGIHRFRGGRKRGDRLRRVRRPGPGVVRASSNPTFLRLAHGDAVLTDVRLSRSFFDLGPVPEPARTSVPIPVPVPVPSAWERSEANFYLPLPVDEQRKDGIYPLVHEGRFSASMDFGHRPTVEHRLATAITVHPAERRRGQCRGVGAGLRRGRTSFALELTFRRRWRADRGGGSRRRTFRCRRCRGGLPADGRDREATGWGTT